MCMNCGCGEPNERHGYPENITADDIRRAGNVNGQDMATSLGHLQSATDRLLHSTPQASSSFQGGAGGRGGGNEPTRAMGGPAPGVRDA